MSEEEKSPGNKPKAPRIKPKEQGIKPKVKSTKREAIVEKTDNAPQTNKIEIEHSKPEIEKMDVQHHPDIEKKGLKEYLLEGVMIFFAVFMGFIAENIREYITNRHKEKDLIVMLASELKNDTTNLRILSTVYLPVHNKWVDSAHLYTHTLPIKGNERKIYTAILNATAWSLYTPPDATLNAIKSTGGFDLIESQKVKSSLLAYSTRVELYLKDSEFLINVQHSVDTAMVSVIDESLSQKTVANQYSRLEKGSSNFLTEADIPADIQFATYNKEAFIIFDRKIDQADNSVNDLFGQYQKLREDEINLLQLLQEEYDLDK